MERDLAVMANLHDLIFPLSEQEFREHLHERSLYFRRSGGESRFGDLLNWQSLRGLIETGAIAADQFLLTSRTKPLPETFYLKDGKVDAAGFGRLFAKDVSLITKPIDSHVPALGVLCADMRARLGETVAAAAVATSGGGGALELHFDAPDVLALQIEGSKRWRIYDRPVEYPVKGMGQLVPPQAQVIFDEILRAGDLLFVPAGYWHHCDNDGPEVSLHLSLLITAPTGWHAMRRLMSTLLAEDAFRVPLSRFDSPAACAAHVASLKAALMEKIKNMPMREFAAEELDKSAAGQSSR